MPSEASREPFWVPVDTIVAINRRATAKTGEPHLLLSASLLESAWARPFNEWSYGGEVDLVRLAVVLMRGVAQNHPFQQGNKRTGFQAALSFLAVNGWRIDAAEDGPDLADAFVALIGHAIAEAEFAERLRPHVRPLD